jgi:hypothetical protein
MGREGSPLGGWQRPVALVAFVALAAVLYLGVASSSGSVQSEGSAGTHKPPAGHMPQRVTDGMEESEHFLAGRELKHESITVEKVHPLSHPHHTHSLTLPHTLTLTHSLTHTHSLSHSLSLKDVAEQHRGGARVPSQPAKECHGQGAPCAAPTWRALLCGNVAEDGDPQDAGWVHTQPSCRSLAVLTDRGHRPTQPTAMAGYHVVATDLPGFGRSRGQIPPLFRGEYIHSLIITLGLRHPYIVSPSISGESLPYI